MNTEPSPVHSATNVPNDKMAPDRGQDASFLNYDKLY
jgi:hypothetical protein